jgi:hypothetical protein
MTTLKFDVHSYPEIRHCVLAHRAATAPPGDSFAGARAKSKTGARTPPPSMQLPSAAAWPPIDLACPVALCAIYQAGLAIHCRAVASACGTRLSRLWIVAACRAASLQFLPRTTLLKKYPVSSLYAKSGCRAIVLSHKIIDKTGNIVRQYYCRPKTAGSHGCRNTHAAPMNTSPVLESAKHILDFVSLSVEGTVMFDRLSAVGF